MERPIAQQYGIFTVAMKKTNRVCTNFFNQFILKPNKTHNATYIIPREPWYFVDTHIKNSRYNVQVAFYVNQI